MKLYLKMPESNQSVSLEHVLNEAQDIHERVEDAASSLSSINETLEKNKKTSVSVETVEAVLVENKETEDQVAEAASDLKEVNAKLVEEVTERVAIESKLADMTLELVETRKELSKSYCREEEARQIAFQDALTGLPNRLLSDQFLDHELTHAKRHNSKLALMLIDVDKFKSINDSYGHDVGNNVLVIIANRLKDFVREEDIVSRWGGDEFVCILLDVKENKDAVCKAGIIRDQIAKPFKVAEMVFSIQVSIGIAIYPEDGETADSLFKNADRAMYKAKKTERGVTLACDFL
jgi:diguanylate cyclase (GGDEF)-like protein